MRRILLALCCAAVSLAGCNAPGDGAGAPTAGSGYQAGDGSYTVFPAAERGAPIEVRGTDLDGKAVDANDWRGEVAVINFWYAACPPCRAEAGDLQQLHEDFADVYFLGVNPRDEAATARAFVTKFALTYPNMLDTNATTIASLQGKVPLQAMPTTIVVDRQGRIYGRILGRITPSVLRGMIEDALAEGK